jgi:hypothetical protein
MDMCSRFWASSCALNGRINSIPLLEKKEQGKTYYSPLIIERFVTILAKLATAYTESCQISVFIYFGWKSNYTNTHLNLAIKS